MAHGGSMGSGGTRRDPVNEEPADESQCDRLQQQLEELRAQQRKLRKDNEKILNKYNRLNIEIDRILNSEEYKEKIGKAQNEVTEANRAAYDAAIEAQRLEFLYHRGLASSEEYATAAQKFYRARDRARLAEFDLKRQKRENTKLVDKLNKLQYQIQKILDKVTEILNQHKSLTKDIRALEDEIIEKCSEETIILDLYWKDVEKRPYPNGERATYYNDEFKLTNTETNELITTWKEWTRVPGGHTHYGSEGRKQITLQKRGDDEFTTEEYKEHARRHSGIEFADPPSNVT